MPVTKQTYTATATWSAAGLASIYRSAFIDAGLMTEWHDSFTSNSIENRILRIQYSPSKVYGTTFYWFMFSASGVYMNIATGWNTSTDQPTGTQWLDYLSTTTSSTSSHWLLSGSLSTLSNVNIIRYTSDTHTWFVSQQGSTRQCFTIQPASHATQSWLDLDKGCYSGFALVTAAVENRTGQVRFVRGPSIRRDLIIGTALNGSLDINDYTINSIIVNLMAYAAPGNTSANYSSNLYSAVLNTGASTASMISSVILPIGFTNTNPAYTSNSAPVFHSMAYTPYSTVPLNSDFGITFHYASNTIAFQDKFIVTAGVEEWEILTFANNTSVTTGASPAFIARVV